nr:hypothetical protein [Streptomyces gossypiisoli]
MPWAGVHGQRCLLLTDGNGGPASRLADRMEEVQLGLAERLLGRAREMLSGQGMIPAETTCLAGQLVDALQDVLRIAVSRGARLGGGWLARGGESVCAPRR